MIPKSTLLALTGPAAGSRVAEEWPSVQDVVYAPRVDRPDRVAVRARHRARRSPGGTGPTSLMRFLLGDGARRDHRGGVER